MADVINQNDPNKQNKVAQPGQTTSAQSAQQVNQPSQVPQPVQAASGSFQNLKKFMTANQPQQFGQQFQNKVGQGAQQAQGNIQSAQNQMTQQVGQANQQLAQTGQNVQQSASALNGTPATPGNPGNPNQGQMPIGPTIAQPAQPQVNSQLASTLVANNAPTDFDQAAAALQAGVSAQYGGPQALGNQDALNQQAQNALATGNAAQTDSGRFALLQQQFARPGYSMGNMKLDNALLSSQGNALEQAREQGRQVSSNLENAKAQALQQAGTGIQNATDVRNQATATGQSALTNTQGQLQSDAQKFAQQAAQMYDPNYIKQQMSGQNIQLNGMDLSPAQKAALAAKYGKVQGGDLTKDQLDAMAKSGDYSSILGQTSADAQAGAGRFNKLAGILGNPNQINASKLLNAGSVGISDQDKAALEGQLNAQATSGAESNYKNAVQNAENQDFQQRIRKTAEDRYNSVGNPNSLLNTMGNTMTGPVPQSPAQKEAWIQNEVKRLSNHDVADDEWAAAQKDAVNIGNRDSDQGKAIYQQQLAKAKQQALKNILGA